jgi:hypothetical protein
VKKILKFLTVFLAASTLFACRGTDDSSRQTVSGTEASASDASSQIYSITPESRNGGRYSICFPQISGASPDIADFYNARWLELADSLVRETAEDTALHLTLDFQVMTQTEDMLSLLFSGSRYYENNPYPTAFYLTYNIHMKTGETICLNDEILDEICESLASGSFSFPSDYSELKNYKSEIFSGSDASAIRERLARADYMVVSTEQGLFCEQGCSPSDFTYYNNGDLRILVTVLHALGDYVTIISS